MAGKKIALLHYWLLTMRGGEKVLEQLCRMFPSADIYTHAAIPEKLSPEIAGHTIIESLIAKLPGGRRYCQHYLPLMPWALRRWRFDDYDLIVSSESGPVKGVAKPQGVRHICYCHTPMRYVWDMFDDYYRNGNFLAKAAMLASKSHLRRYDLKSAENIDAFIANSHFVAERIRRIYDREAAVVHPPVDTDFFGQALLRERTYFLFAGQLTAYKRPDLVLKAFAKRKDPLIVSGDGPLLKSLRKNAPPNIRFTGRVADRDLRDLYAGAKALIFPGVEDFGMVPVEAQAAGCPVVAYGAGGVLESVIPGQTGVFFTEPTPQSLLESLEEFESMRFLRTSLQNNAERFSISHFERNFSEIIKNHGFIATKEKADHEPK